VGFALESPLQMTVNPLVQAILLIDD
jgi:hypothetical protein